MILFRVETPYQLMNAMTMKYSLPEQKADLVLSAASDFSSFLPGIRETGLFENIYLSKDCPAVDDEIIERLKADPKLARRPGDLLLRCGYEDKPYTDLYVCALIMVYNHLLYYHMTSLHGAPKVHLLEEGISSYTLSLTEITDRAESRLHYHKRVPRKKWLENNLASVWLHQPELSVAFEKERVNKLPPMSEPALRRMVETVFGRHGLPAQRYIFFAEPMIEGRTNSCDIELLNAIARRVGQENIIVKPHPRMDPFPFEAAGYTVQKEKELPWEIYAFDPSVQDKVLLTISSTSIFTPKLLNEDYRINAIYLQYSDPFPGRYHTRRRNYKEFITLVDTVFNMEERNIFFPQGNDQLLMAVDYCDGRRKYVG